MAVQVLGSGGPELQDKRASSSYLVWQDGQARVLIDAGGGSALRFGESGAKMSQLDVILFTHFHIDHSADFPSLIFSSWFEDRDRSLPVYGPTGNSEFPSTVDFVRAFFNSRDGIYRYLSLVLVPQEEGGYELQPHNVAGDPSSVAFRGEHLSASAARVIHGFVPALAWRVEIGGKSIVFTGDTNGEGDDLVRLAKDADILVAHNAVPEGATGVERRLHMPPSVIGKIAQGRMSSDSCCLTGCSGPWVKKRRTCRKLGGTFPVLSHLLTISIVSRCRRLGLHRYLIQGLARDSYNWRSATVIIPDFAGGCRGR